MGTIGLIFSPGILNPLFISVSLILHKADNLIYFDVELDVTYLTLA